MALNDIIAMGGTDRPNVLQSYIAGRQTADQLATNKLQQIAARQTIQQNENTLRMSQMPIEMQAKYSADVAKKIADMRNSADDRARQKIDRDNAITANTLSGLMMRPPQERAALWPQARAFMAQQGVDIAQAPEQWDDGMAKIMLEGIKGAQDLYKGDNVTAMDRSGNQIPAREDQYGRLTDYEGNVLGSDWTKFTKSVQDTASGIGLTDTQKGADLQLFQGAAENALNLIDAAGQTIDLVRTSPQSAGYSGRILGGANTVLRTVEGIATALRPDMAGDTLNVNVGGKNVVMRKEDIPNMFSEELSNFRKSAIYSQELESVLTNMAYAAAGMKGQTGRALSDTDLRVNMREIGTATDPIALEKVLMSFMDRSVSAFENKAVIRDYGERPEIKLVRDRFNRMKKQYGYGGKGESTTDYSNMSTDDLLKELLKTGGTNGK